MAAFDSCCCCSLRAGTIFIGMLSLVLSLGGGGLCCLLVTVDKLTEVIQAAYNTYHDLQNPIKVYGPNVTETGPGELNLEDPVLMYIEWGVIATLLFMFVCTVVDVLLIVAAIREAPWMMVPWMVVQWVTIFLTIVIFGIVLWQQLVAMPRYWWAVMFVVAVVILMMMAFVLVLSLYQSVREREMPEFYQGAELVHRHIWLSQKGKYYE
ncbi:uncharacterized protein LOC122262741 isoform X2 [Penaeus japonicus]|uniref:uncharacterized protein LOC122262741 isoform X2 n=1 Tax=Penaeus japonicus TaxID=27405 RepID=UPI001C712AC3|nr:uncharacterized protein LOC122262741 isoform X2 [Penaeus japonicus]